MDPKKIVILVILLIGLVVAGKFACEQWGSLQPPAPTGAGGYGSYSTDGEAEQ